MLDGGYERRDAGGTSRDPTAALAGAAAPGPSPDALSRLAADDAATLVRRLSDVLDDLALAVDGLQVSLGPTIADAAVRDTALMLEAQKLDLVSQSLKGLTDFLGAVGRRRLGEEPLDLDRLAASLTLKSLADRLTGATPDVEDDEADWF